MKPAPRMFSARPRRAGRRAFTLLEILLALTLLGTLLVALNVFVFSMAELWGKGRDERLFLQHVRAVTRHVDETLRAAALSESGGGLAVAEVEDETGREAPELTFTQAEGGRLLDGQWPEQPLPDVDMSLAVVEGRGLCLRWQSRIETRREDDPPRVVVVSPFVVSLAWDYYDDAFKRWETLDEPKRETDQTYPTPARLRLRFAHGAFKAERVLALPVKTEGVTPP